MLDRARRTREQDADRRTAADERSFGASRVRPSHVRLQEARYRWWLPAQWAPS